MKSTRILIVDDDKITRETLSLALEDDYQTLTAKDGMAALQILKGENDIHLVLSDLFMPGMNGIDCVLIGKAKFPEVKFLMLTVYDDEEKLFKAIKAGANGYLLKDERISVIVRNLEILVNDEGVPLSPSMAAKTFDLLKQSQVPSNNEKNLFQLSSRELEVLKLLVDGKDYKEIAVDLFISSNTVKKHIAKIYSKLHVSSKAQAIKMVHFHNLLD